MKNSGDEINLNEFLTSALEGADYLPLWIVLTPMERALGTLDRKLVAFNRVRLSITLVQTAMKIVRFEVIKLESQLCACRFHFKL
jgi:hypothetical protein